MKVDDRAEKQQINNVKKWKSQRNNKKTQECLSKLKKVASAGENIMEISVECAHQGVTTGEWSNVMREVFGEYRHQLELYHLTFQIAILMNRTLNKTKKK